MNKLSLKQKAYNEIKSKILHCEYMPNSFLNEDLLSDELGVSRTPIRDALSRLEQENLIKIVPKKGFFVTPLSIGEINMAIEARILIEPYVIRTYCGHLSSEVLESLFKSLQTARECVPNNDQHLMFALDDEFHRIILNQCNNHYILQTYNNVHNQNSRLRIISGRHDETRLLKTISEHAKVLEALATRDLEGAAKAMEEHLLDSKNSSFQAFMKNSSALSVQG